MVLKLEDGENDDQIFLLDSTCNHGVSMESWDDFRKYVGQDQFYEKVIFRHLSFERSNGKIVKLEEFLESNLGRKYALNPMDILIPNKKDADLISDNNDRTFFCS